MNPLRTFAKQSLHFENARLDRYPHFASCAYSICTCTSSYIDIFTWFHMWSLVSIVKTPRPPLWQSIVHYTWNFNSPCNSKIFARNGNESWFAPSSWKHRTPTSHTKLHTNCKYLHRKQKCQDLLKAVSSIQTKVQHTSTLFPKNNNQRKTPNSWGWHDTYKSVVVDGDLDLNAEFDVDRHDLLDDLGRRFNVDDAFVDAHLEAVPCVGTYRQTWHQKIEDHYPQVPTLRAQVHETFRNVIGKNAHEARGDWWHAAKLSWAIIFSKFTKCCADNRVNDINLPCQ